MWGFYWYSCLHLYNTVSSLPCFNGYFGNLNWRYLHIRGLCKGYEIEYPHKYGLKNGTVPSILGSWNSQWYIYICIYYICIYVYMICIFTYVFTMIFAPSVQAGYALLWGLGARCFCGLPELRRARGAGSWKDVKSTTHPGISWDSHGLMWDFRGIFHGIWWDKLESFLGREVFE